jgi:4-hydroxy-2-oxoheptanedioate aldolase
VAEAALANGKYAGTVGSPANMEDLIAQGYRFLSLGADVVGLAQYCQGIMTACGRCAGAGRANVYGGPAS